MCGVYRMDASDFLRKKMARHLASIQKNPENTIARGQVPNNPPLTPGQRTIISSQYPKSEFAFANNIYPCGPILCSTIQTNHNYYTSQ